MTEKRVNQLLYELTFDSNSMDELYDLMHDDIFRYIYSIVKEKEKAQDLTHDTFIQIYQKAALFDKRHGRAWIFTIARNMTYMSLRKENREVTVDYEIEHVDHRTQDDLHNKVLIEKMMKILNEIEREIIVLHIVDDLSFKDIAHIMNIKLPTVLSKYHRSLKKLKKEMEG